LDEYVGDELLHSRWCSASENGLGDDQHVTRPHQNVLVERPAVYEIVETDANFPALAVYRTDDTAAISGRELGQSTDLDEDVHQRHSIAIRNRARLHGLTEHPDLLAESADEVLNDDADLRSPDVLREHGFDVARELARRLPHRDDVLDERGRNAAVGTDGHRRVQLGL